jgi:rare lipoprotein A
VVLLAGCGHRAVTTTPATAPPLANPAPPAREAGASAPPATPATFSGRIPVTPVPTGGISSADLDFVLAHQPISSEVGVASWYTAPYKGRHSANGEIFSDNNLTAAHRTLPMGSLIVVTNLETRQQQVMRISDRGPFVPDKIIDLTIASAKAIGVYRAGTARVRVDVYETPKPIDTGGRWCVQIGAFKSEHSAEELKAELLERYPGSNVIEFPGEASYWVRIRPEGDDRKVAEYIASHLHPSEGEAYLTRLD